uniref:Nuclear receptor domain-containing protein n=1 Tax=Heterorhabditis bacteriophora TaxID=37862 RepID=A0A1I7XCV5_HETBA
MVDDFEAELANLEMEQHVTMQELLKHTQILHQSMATLSANQQRQESKIRNPAINYAFFATGTNDDKHYTNLCKIFPDPISRTIQATKFGLCENCVKMHNGDIQCRTTCIKCKGRHNTVVSSKKPA